VGRARESWRAAAVWAVGIVAYFVLTTAWLPSWVLRRPAVAGAAPDVTDVVGLAVWGVGLVVGLWGLRTLQRRGLI